jgi:hypothetical protein
VVGQGETGQDFACFWLAGDSGGISAEAQIRFKMKDASRARQQTMNAQKRYCRTRYRRVCGKTSSNVLSASSLPRLHHKSRFDGDSRWLSRTLMITSVQDMSSTNSSRIEKKTTNITNRPSLIYSEQILCRLPSRKNATQKAGVPDELSAICTFDSFSPESNGSAILNARARPRRPGGQPRYREMLQRLHR